MNIEDIKNKILDGEVVKLPTDTVYGLICDANNLEALKKIYEIKKRDAKKPLSVFVKNVDAFYEIIDGGKDSISDDIKKMLEKNWPGALTVICKKKKGVLVDFNDGIDTIGARVPNDKFLLDLLNDINIPLAQTSANISGERDVSSNEVNGKPTKASTIIDITSGDVKVVRQGDVCLKKI